MSASDSLEPGRTPPSREEMMSALFANLVIQQTNMALMLLGQVPNPETGERIQDLDSARMFIDQLEMLEVKTKGNLDRREDQLLKQSLTSLRMAFVETVQAPGKPSPSAGTPPQPAASSSAAPADKPTPPGESEEEHRKKFSKKY